MSLIEQESSGSEEADPSLAQSEGRPPVAVVTGAAIGIGAAIVRKLALEGCRVYCTDIDDQAGQSMLDELRGMLASLADTDSPQQPSSTQTEFGMQVSATPLPEKDATLQYHHLDVTAESDWENLCAAMNAAGDVPDYLVNNAGISQIIPSESIELELWNKIINVTQTGVFLGCKHVGGMMLQAGEGSIVNIGSINAEDVFPKRLPYCAAKAAVVALTRVLAVEWADRNVRVNTVSPGVTRTSMVAKAIADGFVREELYISKTPMRRLAEPEEIADAVFFLLGDTASFITGQNLTVDGGWTANGYYQEETQEV